MFISLLVEIAYGSGRYFGSSECFRDIFHPAYGDARQIHLDQGFFHRGFPEAVTFDDGSLKRDTFEFGDLTPLLRQSSENSSYNTRNGNWKLYAMKGG